MLLCCPRVLDCLIGDPTHLLLLHSPEPPNHRPHEEYNNNNNDLEQPEPEPEVDEDCSAGHHDEREKDSPTTKKNDDNGNGAGYRRAFGRDRVPTSRLPRSQSE